MRQELRFGTVEWAAAKAAAACRHGLSPTRSDCHAKAGNWIRENPELASDPSSRLILFSTPSGMIAHSAILAGGALHHDESDISFASLGDYRVAARIKANVILGAAFPEMDRSPGMAA